MKTDLTNVSQMVDGSADYMIANGGDEIRTKYASDYSGVSSKSIILVISIFWEHPNQGYSLNTLNSKGQTSSINFDGNPHLSSNPLKIMKFYKATLSWLTVVRYIKINN